MVACQQDQAEQPAIVKLGDIAFGAFVGANGQTFQAIDIGDEVVSVARRAGAQAHQVDAEYADVADGAQLPSGAAGFQGWTLLTEDRQGRHAWTEESAIADNRRGLGERHRFGHEMRRSNRPIQPVAEHRDGSHGDFPLDDPAGSQPLRDGHAAGAQPAHSRRGR